MIPLNQSRTERLYASQLNGGFRSYRDVETVKSVGEPQEKRSVYDGIDRDTLFRWVYVPFVTMGILWDYIDSVHNLAANMRVSGLKKPIRTILEAQKECQYEKMKYVENGFLEKERRHSEQLEEDLRDLFNEIYEDCVGESDESLDMKWIRGGIFIAYVLFEAINGYAEDYRRIVKEKYGLQSRNILHPCFLALKEVFENLGKEMCPTILHKVGDWSRRVVGEMHSIDLIEK